VAFPGLRVAIFVHGCFWHRCPTCQPKLPRTNSEFWARKFELNRERDARKEGQLRKLGWVVFVIWECQLLRDPSSVLDKVQAAVTQRQAR
jgi:DNA mismatch endonuclease, patch repair protein